jgi:hypothetical protein
MALAQSMSISLVITTYKRDHLLWRTLWSIKGADEIIVVDDACDWRTERLCLHLLPFPVVYIPRLNRPNTQYSNPSVPINMGLKAASGDIVILQNAECIHDSHVVEQFRERVKERTAIFAKVRSLLEDGSFERWYTAPELAERPYFFCGAMFRKHFMELGGMDEDFIEPGYDDDDFAIRMQKAGIRRDFASDILVTHQWHERPIVNYTPSHDLYMKKHVNRLWF